MSELSYPDPSPQAVSPGEVAYRHGHALLQLRRHADALEHLRQAAALEPADPRPLCLMSAAHLGLEQPSEALRAANDAVQRQPDLGWPHRLRASALLGLGQRKPAKAAALEAVRLEPEEPAAYVVLAQALQAGGDEAGALAAARHAVALNPESAEPRITLGYILLAHDEPAAAEAEFRAALAIEPENTIALNNLAAALARQRRMHEALSGFEQASRSDPTHRLPRENILRIGRRLAWPRRLAIACVLLAVAVALTDRVTGWWVGVAVLLVAAGALELTRWWRLQRLPQAARTLIYDDARARRLQPARWDWSWPARLRPWWWVLYTRLPPPVAFAINIALFALVLEHTQRGLLPMVLFFSTVLSAGRAWKAWRRGHPGRGSWRPPDA